MVFSAQLKINGQFCPLTDRQTQKQNWYENEQNLSNAALHKIIVENKFQPPTNENQIISEGVEPSEIQKLYNWPFSITKNTELKMF